VGSFFEGVMTAGYPLDAADNDVQANIASVGYATILGDVADSYVRNGSYASTNFGSQTDILVKNDITSYDRVAYLKFDLSTVSAAITKATLYLTVTSEGEKGIQDSAYLVPDNTWTESGITWNNAPSLGTQLASWTVPSVDSQVSFDVTTQVQTAQSNGNLISIAIKQPTTQGSNGGASYATKENSTVSYQPVLAIVTQ
jgi:hyaluronate lyase